MKLATKAAPLLGFILLAKGSAPAQTLSSEPVPWLQSLPAIRVDTRTSSFRARLRHVTPGEDGWISERYYQEINRRLKELSTLLTSPPLETAQLAAFLHPEFSGTPLASSGRIQLRQGILSVTKLDPAKEHSLTVENFVTELQSYWPADYALQQAKFKIIAVSLDDQADGLLRTRIWYDFVARRPDGATHEQIGHWQLEWKLSSEHGWRIGRLTAEPAYLAQSPRTYFNDVTRNALGTGPAVEQLRRGLEQWTLELDSAFPTSDEGYSGVAVADVDGDGWEDFYVAEPAGLPNRLFFNNGDGTFSPAAATASIDVLDDTSAVLFLDYDNDGDPDLLVVGQQGPLLFENTSGGNFLLRDSARIGLVRSGQVFHNPMSACAADFDSDGWLDFYLTAYQLQYDETGLATHPVPYHDARNGPPNFFYRNNGDGTFREATEETRLSENNRRFSYACAWGDYNNDGHPDLYVANDFGRNNLYRNNGNGTFTDVAADAGVEDIGAGMSAAWEDYDNDGWLDLYVGNMWSSAGLRVTGQTRFKSEASAPVQSFFRRHAKGNTLFRNRGDGTFEDVTDQAGVALGRWAWSSDFFDFDCDGNEDIFIVNGFLTNESEKDL